MDNKVFLNTIPDEFWTVIEEAGQDPNHFRAMLGNMSRREIARFYWTYEEVANHIRTEQFQPYVQPDLSEDGLAELANWVVAQGKEDYKNILENPEQIPPKKDDPGLVSELVEHFEQHYNDDLPINTKFWDVEWKQRGKKSPWD